MAAWGYINKFMTKLVKLRTYVINTHNYYWDIQSDVESPDISRYNLCNCTRVKIPVVYLWLGPPSLARGRRRRNPPLKTLMCIPLNQLSKRSTRVKLIRTVDPLEKKYSTSHNPSRMKRNITKKSNKNRSLNNIH